ncbi:MAG TPA: hypothetical protein VG056_15460 [Pirellulales bacterium]|jgi:hypothetical protein|nr:hypothetical protein [Pirellulales bacterium]
MTPPNELRAVTEAEIGREIIRLVPHWYEADCGPEQYSIPIGESAAQFHNHCRLAPNLRGLLAAISARTRELPLDRFIEYPGLTDILLEGFVVEWLRMHSREPDWVRLIKYLETVSRRTNENLPVALTLVIQPGTGRGDITQPHVQKFFDRLAASPYTFTYLAVDPDLRLIQYGSVEWSQVNDAKSCKFYPEFLHPIHSVIADTDFVAHLTPRGDLVIMSKDGVLATKRKRRWKIYDIRTFKNSLAYCLGSPHVGANLLEVIFDLSFRRQGALLIYDPEHRIQERILNPESIIRPDFHQNGRAKRRAECGQTLIGRSIEDIAVGKKAGSLKRKRQLIELACIDGAVVFDDNNLLAAGALIRSHPSVGNQMGARKTAARSSYLWGARPVEVSSDGDVTVYFESRNGDRRCDAVMHFL